MSEPQLSATVKLAPVPPSEPLPDERPKPKNWDWKRIDAYVKQLSGKLKYDRDREPVMHLATRTGARVKVLREQEADCLRSSSVLVYGKGHYVIHLRPESSVPRDNFDIAHELGHYFLHALDERGESVHRLAAGRDGIVDDAEKEANRFALALLMPAKDFSDYYKFAKGDPNRLSLRFGVPVEAARSRIKQLFPKAVFPLAHGDRPKQRL